MNAVALDERIEQDRRSRPRFRALLQGRLEFAGRSMTLNCTVRNLTDRGARLSFGSLVALPHEFDLVIDSRNSKRKARLVWSTGLDGGVVFLD